MGLIEISVVVKSAALVLDPLTLYFTYIRSGYKLPTLFVQKLRVTPLSKLISGVMNQVEISPEVTLFQSIPA